MRYLKKQLIVLSVLTALVWIALAVWFAASKEDAPLNAAKERVVFTCNAELVTGLTVETKNGTITMVRREGGGFVLSETDTPLNELRILQMLSEIEEVKSDTVIENVTDAAPYGLEHPSMVISFSYSGIAHRLEIGDYNTAAHRYYARADGGTSVFLISTAVQSAFDVTVGELLAE